jgi:hypothetical protein
MCDSLIFEEISIDYINEKILNQFNFGKCEKITWLQNPEGQWFVNKVFKLTMVDTNSNSPRSPLVLKVGHPWWNGREKSYFEYLNLQYLQKLNIPCPRVYGMIVYCKFALTSRLLFPNRSNCKNID